MKRHLTTLALILLAAPLASAADAPARRVQPNAASGIGLNNPIIGRLVGGGNTLFITSVDVANNTANATEVDFYFDGIDVVTQDPIVIDGSIVDAGLAARDSGGTLRGFSNVHFDDFVSALVDAGQLPAAVRDNGVLGSLLVVFDGFTQSGQGSTSARFENAFGGGTVGVALGGSLITTDEPQELVATIRDTRGRPGPQLYTNMFINNLGLTPAGGGLAGTVTVELTARSNSTGQPVGNTFTLADIGPGQTRGINQVLTFLQVPADVEDTILVFARVVSGDSAIAGAISIVDDTTRDGSVIEMSRADF